jgi:methylmalonyl-CoA/ethylmalonyl-CoA epimerase
MIRGINHLGIAVASLDDAVEHYGTLLDRDPDSVAELPERGVRLCVFRVGGTEIELVEPLGPRGDSLRRFLEKRGEGIHHVCLDVDDVELELERLQHEGFTAVGPPREGALGRRVAFLRPTRGLLVELAEPGQGEPSALEDAPD